MASLSREEDSGIMFRGSCACGNIQYTSTALPDVLVNCNCSQCRKISGAPYLTFAAVPVKSLSWSTPPSAFRFSDIAQRGFCPLCGSSLTMAYHCQPERISVAAGTIDETSVHGNLPKPSMHIFLKEKAGWFQLPEDGLDRWEEFSTPFQEKLDRWRVKEKETKR